jgi:dihydrolipoamide dehydrogenase
VELGHAYGALGCEVHFLVRSRFLRKEDNTISDEFTRAFSGLYRSHLGVTPTKVEYHGDQFTVSYQTKDGETKQITADALLVATGIVSNADTLGLENTDIQLTDDHFIKVDEYLQTSADSVYALGDCIGRYFFRHSVNFEGEYLFNTLFVEKAKKPIRYPPIPHAIFSHPQVAGVGKTEEQLKSEGIDYVAGVNPYAKSAMGMALLSDHGLCKILVDRQTRKILGAHIVGVEASDMIHMLIAFMCKEGTLDDLLNMVYIHPALPEIVRNAARKADAAFKIDTRV